MIQSTKMLEKKFRNVNVVIPRENLGYAKAFNLALKKCKNNFVLTITPDVVINENLIKKIEKIINNFKKFTLLAPEYKNQKIYKNFTSFKNNEFLKKKICNFKMKR